MGLVSTVWQLYEMQVYEYEVSFDCLLSNCAVPGGENQKESMLCLFWKNLPQKICPGRNDCDKKL